MTAPDALVPLAGLDEQVLAAGGVIAVEGSIVIEDADEVVDGAAEVAEAIVVEDVAPEDLPPPLHPLDDPSELAALLEARTPLLARAFSGQARPDRPPSRSARRGSDPDAKGAPHGGPAPRRRTKPPAES